MVQTCDSEGNFMGWPKMGCFNSMRELSHHSLKKKGALEWRLCVAADQDRLYCPKLNVVLYKLDCLSIPL